MAPPLPRFLPSGFLARPVAHRGLHDAAAGVMENTRAAFDAAIAGRYAIECDIQVSADNEAMVFHDFTLDRLTTREGRVDALDARTLRAASFKSGRHGMGTLADLFAQAAGKVPLVVEVKSRFDGDTRMIPRIAALAKDYAGPLVFKSFDPAKMIALREAGVAQPIGIVGEESYAHGEYAKLSQAQKHALANMLHFAESRPDFVSWNHKNLPAAGPYLCRTALGLPVMSWTIRSADAAKIVAAHADQIVFEGFDPG